MCAEACLRASYVNAIMMRRITHSVMPLYSYVLRFAIVPPLTKDINDFVKQWNLHRIRSTAFVSCPGSIPDDMFEMPEYYGTHYNVIMQ